MGKPKTAGLLQMLVASISHPVCPTCDAVAPAESIYLVDSAVCCPSCGHAFYVSRGAVEAEAALCRHSPGAEPSERAPAPPSLWDALTSSAQPRPMPAGTRIRMRQEPDCVILSRRRPLGATAMGFVFLTGIAGIWNGIILFCFANNHLWEDRLSMVPPLLVGLVLAGLWAAWVWGFVLCLVGERWIIRRGHLRCQDGWLGLGRTYPLREAARLDLRRKGLVEARVPPCALVLVSTQGTDMVRLDHLTEDEARWVGDVILRRR